MYTIVQEITPDSLKLLLNSHLYGTRQQKTQWRNVRPVIRADALRGYLAEGCGHDLPIEDVFDFVLADD